jgi:phage tail-like protein
MALGTARTYHKKFKFLVEIDGFVRAAFNKCSELEAEVDEVLQREGGVLTAQKDPGLVNVSDITLERGATDDNDMYLWFSQVVDFSSDTGEKDNDIKRTFDIVQQDRDGTELRRWTVEETWPKKPTFGSWDNDASENVIEKVVLSCRRFYKSAGV